MTAPLTLLKHPFSLALLVLAVAILGFLAARQFINRAAYQLVSESLTPGPRIGLHYTDLEKLDREAFEITTADNLRLRGFFIPTPSAHPAGTIVILHGHLSNADNMAWHAKQAIDAGFNAVVYDARAHGFSDGKVCSFGVTETDDARRVAKEAATRTSGPVYLWGISMGAAVGAQALSGETPFSAGVLFAPFSDLDCMIVTRLAQRRLAWVPGLKESIRKRIHGLTGKDAASISPEQAAKNINVPILVVHGALDDSIPVFQGRRVYDAIPGSRKELLVLPEAGHNNLVGVKLPWGRSTLERVFAFLREAGKLQKDK